MRVIKLFCTTLLVISFNASANQELILNGKYEYRTDSESLEYLGDLVCYFPNEETAKLIKRTKKSKRMVWFCFVPNNEAKIALNVPKKKTNHCGFTSPTSIIVTNYKDLGGFQADTAKLEKVLSLGKVTEIPCK